MPWTVVGIFVPLLILFLTLIVALIRAPRLELTERVLIAAFLLYVAALEYLRYAGNITGDDMTPSISVTIPVAVLVLMRLSFLRSLMFVVSYLMVTTGFQWTLYHPAAARQPSLWMLEGILLTTALLSALWWRLSSRRIWASSLLMTLLAYRDVLTGLANRRALDDHFDRISRLAAREGGSSLYLALLDLDHFKRVNDTYGHEYGDKVLAQVALLLVDSARRPLDMAARIGGEEFVLLLYNCPESAGLTRLETLLQEIRNVQIEHREHPLGHVTCSAGCLPVSTEMSLNQALRVADRRLYQAKLDGRNRIVASGPR